MDRPYPDRISVDGAAVAVVVVRKRVKNLNARLRDGTLHVSAPLRASRGWILACLPEMARALLRRERKRDLGRDGRALAVARRVAARFPHPPEVAAVEFTLDQSSCWGTFSGRTRTVRVAAVLRHMPEPVLEAVVAHELCHAFHRTHGPRFRALLEKVCPRAPWSEGFLDGALWLARRGGRIPAEERGPLREFAPEPPAPRPARNPRPRTADGAYLFEELRPPA